MDRRTLLTALFGAATVAVIAPGAALALPPLAQPTLPGNQRDETDFQPDIDGEAQPEQAQYIMRGPGGGYGGRRGRGYAYGRRRRPMYGMRRRPIYGMRRGPMGRRRRGF
jgi:hypothetical protein